MNIQTFLTHLHQHPDLPLGLVLPDGSLVPAHFHITELGHVTKRFIDCGGTRRHSETCLLQTWVHEDTEHRLHAGKLAEIFKRSGDLALSETLPVEIEHELESATHFTVEQASVRDGVLWFQLGVKQTDCLARGVCLPNTCAPAPFAAPAPFPAWTPTPKAASRCTPQSGCC
ncbi:MAG: hypothetical protein RLZZ244_2643 [Verrucomicrobiota bacterium]|jgi:hypothetical protein